MNLVNEKEPTILRLGLSLWVSAPRLFLGFPSANALCWRLMVKRDGLQEALGDSVDKTLKFSLIVLITIWSTGSQKCVLRDLAIWRLFNELRNLWGFEAKSPCQYSHVIQYCLVCHLTIRLRRRIFFFVVFWITLDNDA